MTLNDLHLVERKEGVVLGVRARAGARRNEIVGVHGGSLKVSVTQAPEKGKANEAIVALLAKQLGISKSQITLLSGQTNSNKSFLIECLAADKMLEQLRGIIGGAE